MPTPVETAVARLTFSYFVGLAGLAALALASFLLAWWMGTAQQQAVTTFDLCNDQRLQVERAAWYAEQLAEQPKPAEHPQLTAALAQTAQRLAADQTSLREGDDAHAPLRSAQLAANEQPLADYVAIAQAAVQAAQANAGREVANHAAALAQRNLPLQQGLDALLTEQRHTAERQRFWNQAAQLLAFATTLLLLVIGITLVVPPRVRHVHELLHQLADAEVRWRATVNSISDGLIILDDNCAITAFNPAAERIFGYRAEEIIGRSFKVLLPEPYRSHHQVFIAELLADEDKARGHEVIGLHQNGGVVHVEASFGETYKEGKRMLLGVMRDIGVRKQLEEKQNEELFLNLLLDIDTRSKNEEKLLRLATTDPLTGAFNRLKFEEYLEREVNKAKRHDTPLAVVMFDIDHFKRVNDTYGHPAGDQVLNRVAAIAQANLRGSDLFARWGGEEFMILAAETELEGGHQLAEKIRRAISEYDFEEVGHVTSSFGVAQYHTDETSEVFLKRVDDALYQAKQNGRNQVRRAG